MKRKTISMPDAMGDWITDRVQRGQYNNESEYIRDLVRQDQEEQEKMAFLNRRIDEGRADYSAGRYTTISSDDELDTLFDKLIEKPNRANAKN